MNEEVRKQLRENAAARKRVLADGGQIVLNVLVETRVGDDEQRLARLNFAEIESLIESLKQKASEMRSLITEYEHLKAER